MAQNDFLPFATGPGANVVDQATYAGLPVLGTGFTAGIAQSNVVNKAIRQANFMAAALAAFIAQVTPNNVLDDGVLAEMVANIQAAVTAGSIVRPARTVVASAAMNILQSDYAVGFNRTVAPAATQAQLPLLGNPLIGQEFVVQDLAGNAFAFPITVLPPAGQSIAGLANYVIANDRQSASFRWYGNNLWGLKV